MKQPLFSIGEKVRREAATYKESNGEYIVEEVISSETMTKLHPNMEITEGSYYYKLSGFEILKIKKVSKEAGGICNHSWEGWLRKIHKPSQFSFDQLISEIKCPRSITQ